MPSYPPPSEYQEALQAPAVAFADSELQNGTPRTNALGLPQPVTGSFAAVFPMTTDAGRRYAVKCFLAEMPDQQARYEAVAEVLEGIDHDAFVEFAYQPEGISVRGEAYPLLKMKWAEGIPLNRFAEKHLDRPGVLDRLAEAWAGLMADLESMDLAHGDLQHGNVLVETAGEALRLRLVDYDTMYVPALKGRASAEVGHRNYQHPDRTDADFGPALDCFSGLVIYTALRACAVRPELWDEYDTGENLLFRDADFYAPEESPLFGALGEIEPLRALSDALRTACYVEPADVPPLPAVRDGRLEPSQVSVSRSNAQRGRDTGERSTAARVFLPVTIGGVGMALGLAGVGRGLVAAGVLLAGASVGAGVVATRYRRLSLVRRRRRLEQEADRFRSTIQELEREVASLQEKRDELRTSMAERRQERLREIQEQVLHDRLKHHFVEEVRDVEGLTHKHVVRLKAANLRTASELTPAAVDAVRRISDRARARLKMWRAALEERYADEIPDALSPAQERRLQRYIEHRIDDLGDQIGRTREKIQTQRTELERIEERLDEMPNLSVGHYVCFLLRLAALPDRTGAPPEPSRPHEVGTSDDRAPVPEPVEDDRSWWTQG
ncbi:hypothetical protein [Salinibacter altiplanensis]|uniref:hypothetical protein n=1 Tax=Salinibacter altiplanensis TaxID=1803181 RepID=UPI000C9EF6F6|nr:hypothetical protein [Salinibacter altiplanensis]